LSAHTQPEAIVVSHGALPNLQTSKRKLESNIFASNLLPHLEWPVAEYKMETISCSETLAYFKYKTEKIKIITNTHFCVII
jgi:hypothetical protein